VQQNKRCKEEVRERERERERERAMAARKGLFGLTSTRAGEAAINWYPGHMASATKAIRERIKLVDLVLEVRDARIPLSSANVELQDALEHKKRLIVLNKMDLANPNMMLVSSNGSLFVFGLLLLLPFVS
jgi:hypothetical protein